MRPDSSPQAGFHAPLALSCCAPEMDLLPNTILRFGPRTLQSDRWIVRQRVAASGNDPSVVEIENLRNGKRQFLSDAELANRARTDELHIDAAPDGTPVRTPGPRAARSPEEEASVLRRRAYLEICGDVPRTKEKLRKAIAGVAAARGEKPPHPNTVINWMDLWDANQGANRERFGDGALERRPNPGNRRRRVIVGDVAKAVQEGVIKAVRLHKGTAANALSFARGWFAEHRPGMTVPTLPSVRMVNYEIGKLNLYIKEDLRYGTRAAEAKFKGVSERPRPELPLQEVEVDHTPLSILLFDETRQVLFGRPDVITFRDRCTGCVLGMSIGFEQPSYTSFLAGLQHAFFPKDMAEFPGVQSPWFCFGRPKALFVDNALHFIGDNIRHAAGNLGVELVEFVPASPWLKGAEEGLFRILERNVHDLPGSVFSNVEERKRYAETGELPVLTITELRAFLTYWVCEVYHPNPHEGLGFLRTLEDIPERLWRTRIGAVHQALPPPQSEFVALAGDTDERAVTTKGIRWDHIRYEHDDLRFIRTDSKHRTGRGEKGWEGRKYRGSKYRVVRDPTDLGRITVVNPYATGPRTIEVPAVRLDYASGLSLHQHRVFVANNAAVVLDAMVDREERLVATRDAITLAIGDLMLVRRKYDIESKLARFRDAEHHRHRRSVVTAKIESESASSDFMDPRKASPLPRPATVSPNAAAPTSSPFGDAAGAPFRIATPPDALPSRMDFGGTMPAPGDADPGGEPSSDGATPAPGPDGAIPAGDAPFDPRAHRQRMKESRRWTNR